MYGLRGSSLCLFPVRRLRSAQYPFTQSWSLMSFAAYLFFFAELAQLGGLSTNYELMDFEILKATDYRQVQRLGISKGSVWDSVIAFWLSKF